jgi:lysophospholipase L1-like esterase
MKRLLPVLALVFCASVAFAAEPNKTWTFDPALLKPFWLSDTMLGESVLFIKDHGATEAKASLLFVPTKILSVRNSSGDTTYVEGKDYLWKPNSREIGLPAGSKIVFKTPTDLRRSPGSQPYRLVPRDGKGEIMFGGGHEYHDMQTVITYEHQPNAWAGPKPTFVGNQLPNTLKILREKKPLTIGLLGDSISTGCNASGWANAAPYQPAYQDLLAMNLEAAYGGKVTVKNFAVGGTGSAWGVQTIGKVVEAKPDLVILAFGMNDVSGVATVDYQANLKRMIDAVHDANPKAEVILVASMLGNRDWVALRHEYFIPYRDALAQLCKTGIVLADMTSMWTELFKYKKDWDMTGNGVNHPNDFGHRIYAQVLSTLLIAK